MFELLQEEGLTTAKEAEGRHGHIQRHTSGSSLDQKANCVPTSLVPSWEDAHTDHLAPEGRARSRRRRRNITSLNDYDPVACVCTGC